MKTAVIGTRYLQGLLKKKVVEEKGLEWANRRDVPVSHLST